MQIELDTRIKLEEASHKRRKDWLLFKVGVYALVTFAFLGMWLVLAASEAAQRNWALALTAMITGLFGYLSGRHKS
jgi:hypothetical protein